MDHQTSIDILILEDNDVFRKMLKKELFNTINKLRRQKKIKFTFHLYPESKVFINDLKNAIFKNKNVIAFIDYYLGEGLNGKHILKLITDFKQHIKPIVITQSENVIRKYEKGNGFERNVDYILKDQYVFLLCSLFLEQYIEAKS